MSRLMVGGDEQLLFLGALLHLAVGEHLGHGRVHVGTGNNGAVVHHGANGGLVEQGGNRGAGHADRLPGQVLQIDVRGQVALGSIEADDRRTVAQVGQRDSDLPIKAARPDKGWIELLEGVSSCDSEDAAVLVHTVHFGQQRVEGLAVFLVLTSSAGTANGVDLVDEYDAGGILLGLLVEGANILGALANPDVDELGSVGGVKLDTGGASNGLGHQRLTGTRGAVEQDTAGNLGTDSPQLGGVAQALDHEGHILLGLLVAGNIVKGGGLAASGRGTDSNFSLLDGRVLGLVLLLRFAGFWLLSGLLLCGPLHRALADSRPLLGAYLVHIDLSTGGVGHQRYHHEGDEPGDDAQHGQMLTTAGTGTLVKGEQAQDAKQDGSGDEAYQDG